MTGILNNNFCIKSITFNGTTDETGNLNIAKRHLYVVGVRFTETSFTGYCFIYVNGETYLRVLSNSNILKPNTKVSGTIYYIE